MRVLISTNKKPTQNWDPTSGMASLPLAVKYDDGSQLFYTRDANKNVTEMIFSDQNNGIGAHYEYDAFGKVTVNTRNTPIDYPEFNTQNPFRFSSEYHDDELGMVYYNYRHYNPLNGRWISRDPIEEEGGYNLYGMVNNNISNAIDLLGEVIKIFTEPTTLSDAEFDKKDPKKNRAGYCHNVSTQPLASVEPVQKCFKVKIKEASLISDIYIRKSAHFYPKDKEKTIAHEKNHRAITLAALEANEAAVKQYEGKLYTSAQIGVVMSLIDLIGKYYLLDASVKNLEFDRSEYKDTNNDKRYAEAVKQRELILNRLEEINKSLENTECKK